MSKLIRYKRNTDTALNHHSLTHSSFNLALTFNGHIFSLIVYFSIITLNKGNVGTNHLNNRILLFVCNRKVIYYYYITLPSITITITITLRIFNLLQLHITITPSLHCMLLTIPLCLSLPHGLEPLPVWGPLWVRALVGRRHRRRRRRRLPRAPDYPGQPRSRGGPCNMFALVEIGLLCATCTTWVSEAVYPSSSPAFFQIDAFGFGSALSFPTHTTRSWGCPRAVSSPSPSLALRSTALQTPSPEA